MKKRCVLVILLCFWGLLLSACNRTETEQSVLEGVRTAPVVKLEFAEHADNTPIFVDNVGTTISIADMRIQASDHAFDEEWLYRFTYNPQEKVIDGQEIVLLFGQSSMGIDGVTYLPEEGAEYASILEWAEGVYNYYNQ